VVLVRTNVPEEGFTPIIRLRIIHELRLLATFYFVLSSPILVTLMIGAIRSSENSVLREPRGATSQKTLFFTFTAMETSYLI
jgi:hypothetical protein